MSDIAISVENVSKLYRLGLKREDTPTLAGTLFSWVKAPVDNLRRLRRLTRFTPGEEGQDVLWALRDVSFEVKHGEVVGIIGRNGAGKSTLLKILSRITEPTYGRAVLRGRVGSLLEVGTGFHPELTGRENVYMNGTILGMTKKEIDRKFDEIVDFSGVEKFLDTPVKHYSSGMSVRLAFAVAAHLNPEILIVDEVLAVGDASFQQKCLSRMEDVSKAGKTVLFVSHNLTAMANLCRRGILLQEGRILKDGPIDQAVADYLERAMGISMSLGSSERRKHAAKTGPMVECVQVCNDRGEPSDRFSYDEPIRVRARLAGVSETFCFTVLIRNLRGECAYHIRSQDYGFLFSPNGQGSLSLETFIPRLSLAEGVYAVTAWLGTAADVEVDVWKDCVFFKVEKSGPYVGQLMSLVLPQVQWLIDGGGKIELGRRQP